jgi:hypothetical protein
MRVRAALGQATDGIRRAIEALDSGLFTWSYGGNLTGYLQDGAILRDSYRPSRRVRIQ